MANYSFSRLERCYLQKQPTFGVIPNAGGSASVAGADACRFIRMSMTNDTNLLVRPDKTGTRSAQGMARGRSIGQWSIEMSLVGSGTAGTEPDCDPILSALFGQDAAVGTGTGSVTSSTDATPIVLTTAAHSITSGTLEVVSISGHTTNTNVNGVWLAYAGSGTSLTLIGSRATGNGAGAGGTWSRAKLTYTFVDDPITMFTMFSFRTASSLDQRVAHSCVVSEASFTLGQDVATWSATGECMWVLSSKGFGSADANQRAGLTNFPTEPGSPVTNGNIIPGFTGRFVMGDTAAAATYATAAKSFPTIRTATLTVRTANAMVRDTFGTYYPTMSEGGERNVSMSFSIYDDDSAEVQTIKEAGDQKTPQDIVFNLGTQIGNTWVFILKNVYLDAHQLDDGQLRFAANFGDSRATATSTSVKDEFTLIVA